MASKQNAPKAPDRRFIRPKTVDVGRGPEPAVLKFKRAPGNFVVVPEAGLSVIWEGRERRFWQRRINDGAAEIVDSPPAKTEPAKPGPDSLAADKPHPRKPKQQHEET